MIVELCWSLPSQLSPREYLIQSKMYVLWKISKGSSKVQAQLLSIIKYQTRSKQSWILPLINCAVKTSTVSWFKKIYTPEIKNSINQIQNVTRLTNTMGWFVIADTSTIAFFCLAFCRIIEYATYGYIVLSTRVVCNPLKSWTQHQQSICQRLNWCLEFIRMSNKDDISDITKGKLLGWKIAVLFLSSFFVDSEAMELTCAWLMQEGWGHKLFYIEFKKY